jgi:hypothetical protein
LPKHDDGYFVGYANHSNVLLAWDPETLHIKSIHHAYVDEYNVRTLEDEKLTPNSVLLKDMPPSILDKNGQVDSTKIHTVDFNLKETKDKLNPAHSVTIDITLPLRETRLGIKFTSDEMYGFALLTKVAPTSPLSTQIPMNMHCNCWVIAMNLQANGYIEPITDKFCFEEIVCCQEDK